ncbi:phosphonate C-P lyase system protein PhnL [Iningainema tapete]|uniref:Phosphonate C-P lyase system protein PhnL n=1 Tax=Iningainema tapete BLCC-T55 TaxID=2748662 RepID=A0A8J6XC53_9CYAN|nr:phosphonate C-P lyase system protein PhnL [Iningainema tapete]MBD2772715.1 phosphonate C-P lyase system protein PhnL [Iningainema tapete BLCC-T55]
MSSNIILRTEGLSKSFLLQEQGKHIPSAQNVSLEVQAGKLTALTGASGTGKSSLLKCIYRTYLPTKGAIYYHTDEGEWIDLAKASERDILALRRTEISFVTQFLHCLPRQSTIDVVAKPLFDLGIERTEARERAKELLSQIHLPQRLWEISPSTFSGGEKQRVNLARAMILRPRLLLLDEPTASLDPTCVSRVIEMVSRLKKAGTGILAIFHDQELVKQLADFDITLTSAEIKHS